MPRTPLPTLPPLFKTVGDFLAEASVPPGQRDDQREALEAFHAIAYVLYGETKAYPCIKRAYISPMPSKLIRPCLIRGTLVSPLPLARARK
jgi:hypothetical protein